MKRYMKKPVVIEAGQWLGPSAPFDGPEDVAFARGPGDSLIIPTLEGTLTASVGDWIIRGVKGEYYPCKPDVFEQTYRRVD